MTIENLAEFIVISWCVAGIGFALYAWFNIPILLTFLIARIAQLRDPLHDVRTTTPTHTALHIFCAAIYGLMLPSFYFLSVRTRHALGPWYLGPDTNTDWTIALGIVCMAWLAAHLLEAAMRLGRLRFGPSWLDRAFALLAFALCLWFHVKVVAANLTVPPSQLSGLSPSGIPTFFSHWFMRLIYPQSCFLGATLVFGLALVESLLSRPDPGIRRRWRGAVPVAVVLILTLFSPFWLSIPRVTHRQAITLIEENRDRIIETAEIAELDPQLLAGIIYMAQTRDHPRLIGDALERFGLTLWDRDVGEGFSTEFGAPLINASAGLCQIRPTTAVQTVHILDQRGGLVPLQMPVPGLMSKLTYVQQRQGQYISWRWMRLAYRISPPQVRRRGIASEPGSARTADGSPPPRRLR